MKKGFLFALTALLTVSMASSVSAGTFTDFESYPSFSPGDNLVYGDGDAGDYWIGNWSDAGGQDTAYAEIVEGKGVDGSKALQVSSELTENVGLYLFATAANGIATDHGGANYLRVWMDFSNDVGFRKGNFGTTDSTYSLFTTDEENANRTEWPFYYLADGGDTWETMYHGGDGCFGDAQESDISGLKGYFAFPVEDFVIRENANWEGYDVNTPAPMNDVTGVYLFWDYAEHLTGGDPFYLDNIEFVEDYQVFASAAPAEEEIVPEEPAAVSADTAPSELPTEAPVETAVQTSDALLPLAVTGAAVLALTVILQKRRGFSA